MSKRSTVGLLALAALAGLPVAANAQIKGIFSNVAGASNNVVPTVGGVFNPGVGSASAFDRAFVSPNGSLWILGALKDDPTDDKDIIIVGTGTSMAGAVTVAVEDSPTTFDPTRTYAILDQVMGINNAGQFCFTADLDGATTDDEVLVLFDGANFVPVIREGSPSPIAGQNFGLTIDAAHILADGTVRYRAALSPATTKFILGESTGTVLSETDVSIPTGQLVAPDQSVDLFSASRFTSSSSGASHIWHGDLNGPTTTDLVMVVNGGVVAQEGVPLPGGIYPGVNLVTLYADNGSQVMSPNGNHWAFRATMADTIDVVVKNGALVAKTDDPITPGSTELWDDVVFSVTFFMNAVNDNGDMVIGGVTNNPDVNFDGVLVYHPNGGTPVVLAREGDPIDLDGNGSFDDDAFIDIFGNDDGVLTNDGKFYFVASIQNSLNVSTGNAFLVINVPTPPSGCYANCDQSSGSPLLTANDFQCFLNKFAANDTYANCDQSTGTPLLTANDFQCFLNKFAAGCT
ncbi:MAG: hypothetical protein KF678_01760 [Phycisphaeraceae bacterium]|nr:hypothetical protein [Phycisphaeraceae bacterium]